VSAEPGWTNEERQERYDRAVEHGRQINARLRATLSEGRTDVCRHCERPVFRGSGTWLHSNGEQRCDLRATPRDPDHGVSRGNNLMTQHT
jgi:hypothetical protein